MKYIETASLRKWLHHVTSTSEILRVPFQIMWQQKWKSGCHQFRTPHDADTRVCSACPLSEPHALRHLHDYQLQQPAGACPLLPMLQGCRLLCLKSIEFLQLWRITAAGCLNQWVNLIPRLVPFFDPLHGGDSPKTVTMKTYENNRCRMDL